MMASYRIVISKLTCILYNSLSCLLGTWFGIPHDLYSLYFSDSKRANKLSTIFHSDPISGCFVPREYQLQWSRRDRYDSLRSRGSVCALTYANHGGFQVYRA